MTSLETLVAKTNNKHGKAVSAISRIIALKYGYSHAEAEIIGQAALYHDVGKSVIPLNLLTKPGPLTEDESAIVRKHTDAGFAQIMDAAGQLLISAEVARQHHERLDGSGYHNISGNDISHYSRLIAVADVFDALISHRPYKEPWCVADAIRYLADSTDKFDSGIVRCLAGEIGSVMSAYKDSAVQP